MSLDFVGFDVETANRSRGSICAIGLVRVENGRVVDTRNLLCRPPADDDYFDPVNISIHGITWDDVRREPPFQEQLQVAQQFIGELPVVAHNAGFDLGAVRAACDSDWIDWPTLDYGCTLVLSRRALTLISYSLPLVCEALNVPLEKHHDAGADALAAAQVALRLAERTESTSLDQLLSALEVRMGRIEGDAWRGCTRMHSKSRKRDYNALPDTTGVADPDHPFFGQTMVFTGTLSIRRSEAWAAVAALGAIVEDDVTKRTTMLVVGDGFTGNSAADFTTSKARNAVKWLEKGHPIEVLNEDDFMLLLLDGVSGSRRKEISDS